MKLSVVWSLCLTACVSAAAVADDEVVRRLSDYQFETESWNFNPVYDPATGLVDAIVAIAKPDATIGDNLNTVLFIRTGNQFEAWSWRNATRARAVYSSKMILAVSDDDDSKWMLEEELPWLDDNALRPPTPYLAGMLTDDPLYEPLIESNDPQALLDMLASLGYPVTANRPEGGEEHSNPPCPEQVELLLRMAGATEWSLTAPTENQVDAELNGATMASMLSNCSEDCEPYQTPLVKGPQVPVGCEWLLSAGPSCIQIAPGTDRCTCTYQARKVFTQTKTGTRRYADCRVVTCQQTATVHRYGGEHSCSEDIARPAPLDPPYVCPTSPSCALTDPVCNATSGNVYSQWLPVNPCPP